MAAIKADSIRAQERARILALGRSADQSSLSTWSADHLAWGDQESQRRTGEILDHAERLYGTVLRDSYPARRSR